MDNNNKYVNTGSIYFIEEFLIEQLLKENREINTAKGRYTKGLGSNNEILSRTFKILSKKYKTAALVNANVFQDIESIVVPANDDFEKARKADLLECCQHSYERQMAMLAYWSPYSRREGGNHIDQPHHTLNQPTIINNSIDNWPYAVIPSFERNGSDDDDIKKLKSVEDLMVQLQDTIIRQDAANSNAWKTPSGAAAFLAGAAGLAVGARNLGLLADEATVTAASKENAKRYNALWKDRERVYQSSIRTPFDQRHKYYTDPSNREEGTWFLSQLEPSETLEGLTEDGKIFQQGNRASQFYSGLLVKFNEVLSKYLYSGWDPVSRKIYGNLISKFANGTHNNAITKGESLNDINSSFTEWNNGGAELGTCIVGVPRSHVVVWASLSRAMRNILMNVKRSGDPEFRSDSLAELPIYMKENLKANLPGFQKLFKLIIKKAEFLRQISQQVSLKRELPFQLKYGISRTSGALNTIFPKGPAANGTINAVEADLISIEDVVHNASGFHIRRIAGAEPAGWTRGTGNKSRYQDIFIPSVSDTKEDIPAGYVSFAPWEELSLEKSKQWHTSLLDDILSASGSVLRCAEDTYKELADEPKFLELNEGFITDYQNMNKRQPLMTLVSLQLPLEIVSVLTIMMIQILVPTLHLMVVNGIENLKLVMLIPIIFYLYIVVVNQHLN